MTIPRDDKDWTWVLDRRCPECGFEASAVDATDVGRSLRDQLPTWDAALQRPDATRRPDDVTWSPTEYACHVRDVARLYAWRLQLMLSQDDPLFDNWSSDDAAAAYADEDPSDVLPQLRADVSALADAFDAVGPEDWARPGRRSDGANFTVDTFSRYLLHDVVHHGWDVSGRRPRA